LFTSRSPVIDVHWGEGSPRKDVNVDDFGVRWTSTFKPRVTGKYRLALIGTMRFRLFLDDSLVARSLYPTHDGEFPDPRLVQTDTLELDASKTYRLNVEAEESYGDAQLQLLWSPPHETLEAEAVAAAKQADAVVMFLGLTARLEGEEMNVQVPGFRGG